MKQRCYPDIMSILRCQFFRVNCQLTKILSTTDRMGCNISKGWYQWRWPAVHYMYIHTNSKLYHYHSDPRYDMRVGFDRAALWFLSNRNASMITCKGCWLLLVHAHQHLVVIILKLIHIMCGVACPKPTGQKCKQATHWLGTGYMYVGFVQYLTAW